MADALRGADGIGRPLSIASAGWWKEAAARLLARINQHRVLLIAAGVTYYLLLAMVPTLSLLVSLYGLFNDRTTVSQHIGLLAGIVPAGALSIIEDQLTRLTSAPQTALSLTLVGSLLVALWSSSAGVKALFDAMNVAYEQQERRNFLVLNTLALVFTLCGIIAALVAIGAVVVVPAVLQIFFPGWGGDWQVSLAAYLVMLIVLVGGVGALYRWGPSQHPGKRHWISPGTVLTIVATVLVSVLFSWYAANLGNYNAAYGSLGALVGMLTWLWLTVSVLIVGAELNAEIEVRSRRKGLPVPVATAPPAQSNPRASLATLIVLLPAALLLAWASGHRNGR
ncbi:MAG TPA: YihY/virulence factor BrkB family protein [Devosiaceae bacterium]|nr:YihY/virulence factor BrkB family protein [Devosiaceae bacterium]